MGSKFFVHLRRQWMGALALFLVLTGGVAYAANTVFSTDIVDGEVKSADLANNAVRTTKIANRQVTQADLAAPEAWHEVGPGSTTQNLCDNAANTAVFCSSHVIGPDLEPWQNFGGEHASAAFYKDQLGIVHLKGLVRSIAVFPGPDPSVWPIFRLPAAYRPSSQRVFASIGQGGGVPGEFGGDGFVEVDQARVDVKANGLVVLEQDCAPDTPESFSCSAGPGHLTLDGIGFRPDE